MFKKLNMNKFVLFSLVFFLFSCKKNTSTITNIPNDKPIVSFSTPSGFPAPMYLFDSNEVNNIRFRLGKFLFYDPILSSDSTVSCSTCHAQSHGFADHNIPFSKGVGGQYGKRNAPPIFNAAWMPEFFWDGRVHHLDDFSIGPITNPVEMNETSIHVVKKLNRNTYYRKQFKSAYNVDSITEINLRKALSQYMAMVISSDSKYDKYINGKASFSSSEQNGFTIFKSNCASCHVPPLFTDYSFRNNGLDSVFTDLGRAVYTKNSDDYGKFKVPTLRNIELTYPYMHDGRYIGLMDVINHYSNGIHQSVTLDKSLSTNLQLSPSDKKDLFKFLLTLTDYTLLSDTLVAEPKR